MTQLLFSVYDSAADLFLPTWHASNIEVALRRFRKTVNTPAEGNPINEYPEDYTLFHVGEFNQETGEVISLATPHSLGVAVIFRTPDQPVPTLMEASN